MLHSAQRQKRPLPGGELAQTMVYMWNDQSERSQYEVVHVVRQAEIKLGLWGEDTTQEPVVEITKVTPDLTYFPFLPVPTSVVMAEEVKELSLVS